MRRAAVLWGGFETRLSRYFSMNAGVSAAQPSALVLCPRNIVARVCGPHAVLQAVSKKLHRLNCLRHSQNTRSYFLSQLVTIFVTVVTAVEF